MKVPTQIHLTISMQLEPHLKSEYELLFKAMSFLEMFKFLLQLYIVQEDTFRPHDIDPAQLAVIAEKMGYIPIGTVSAWDQLVIDYYRYVKEVRRLCDFLLEDLTAHLSSVSVIVKMLLSAKNRTKEGKYKNSLPKDFIESARFFTGTKYWEDVLNLVESNPRLLDDFVDGFDVLNEKQKNKIIKRYVEWSQYSSITLINSTLLADIFCNTWLYCSNLESLIMSTGNMAYQSFRS